MPRIDPQQLLKCLSVLLGPTGAIKSKDEVQRLASLMNKFSKKLVSKCIYVLILKQTEVELLGSFMGVGGWSLVHMWLSDGIQSKNWPLVKELLELLLLCPVDVERLKINDCPKLVKNLTKDDSQPVVQLLASKLVEQWLKLVKGGSAPPLVQDQLTNLVTSDQNLDHNILNGDRDSSSERDDDDDQLALQARDFCDGLSVGDVPSSNRTKQKVTDDGRSDKNKNQIPILKISVKDGKQIVSKVPDKSGRKSIEGDKKSSDKSNNLDKENNKTKKKDSDKHKSSSSNRSSSSKSSKSKHSSSERRQSSESRNSSDGHKSSSKSSKEKERHSSSSSKDGAKSKDKKQNDKERGSSDKNKDSSSKDDKLKDIGQNKSLAMSIMKLGKIPKKTPSSDDKSNEAKKEKPSISIEVRKSTDQNRPKTVKMFNSKFRSHGLEEEARPPPPRGTVKKPTVPPTLPGLPVPLKRPSPIRSMDAPPEKKAKLVESPERPGSIKLIPPKPKPTYLLESGLFMDALTASATNKKEPKKRKRRISGSKDDKSHGENSPPTSPTLEPTSPNSDESKPAPLRFYQDTLETEDEDKGGKANQEKKGDGEESAAPKSPSKDDDDDDLITSNAELEEDVTNVSSTGLKGVLCVHKRKGPKKTLRWREDSQLQEIHYFELDETERVNVSKTFSDMKQMEHTNEREAFKKGRNLPEDSMVEKTMWRKLITIDIDKTVMSDHGKNSKEKHIQMNRQAQILPAIYYNKNVIPDSPAEPDHENHPIVEPTTIPLDDVTGNPDSVNDFQNTPWPEPKIAPQSPNMMGNPHMFPQIPPFGPGFNQAPFPMPGFPPGPGIVLGPGDWPGPGMIGPDGIPMNPDMFMGPGPGYQTAMGDYPMMENGPSNFPSNFNGPMGNQGMNRSMGPGGNYGFQKNRGGMRGGLGQRGGHMPWRGKGPGGWSGPPRGRGRLCNHFQKKGFCRQGDACPFVHGNPGHY